MNECNIKGCRNLQTTCIACGRLVIERILPPLLEWISVEDRLPNDDEAVLMCEMGRKGLPLIGWYEVEDVIPGFYIANSFQDARVHVTHWIPIPKPPEPK